MIDRADAKCSYFLETEANPTTRLITRLCKSEENEAFARGGMYRNLMGGAPIKDNFKIVLWCDKADVNKALHLGIMPR